MKRKGELDKEIDEKVNTVDVVNDFLHTIELSASADSFLNFMHESEDNIIHADGLCVLLEQSDLVKNSLMRRELFDKLSHHFWAILEEK